MGNEDRFMDGATDGASVELTLVSEVVCMNDGMHDGINVGTSLGFRE